MSGGWPSQAGKRGGGAGRSPKGDYPAPRFPPEGLGLDGRGAAGPDKRGKAASAAHACCKRAESTKAGVAFEARDWKARQGRMSLICC